MAHFEPVIVISSPNEKEIKELIELFGYRCSLKAIWNYSGEIIEVENERDIERLNKDEEYAEKKLLESNLRV